MDYAALRAVAIGLLERLAGPQWTDFNAHDPGITILEQLCYAITDLGYRIDYDLKDLLAGGESDPYRALYSPAAILTTEPVTLTDLRKIVIDVDGVKNAWIEPVDTPLPALHYDPSDKGLYLEAAPQRAPVSLPGVHRVLIEADGSILDLDLASAVQRRLQACRSLGQAFEPPVILGRQPITVTAGIEVGAIDDPDRLLAQIYYALARFISPRIRFYTLTEMLARGLPIDEIMEGPALRHGFIDTDELEQFDRKTGLRGSDLIQQIMDVPGVSTVNDLTLSDGVTTDPWYLNLSQARNQNSTPVLNISTDSPTITLTRNGVVARTNPDQVKQFFDALQQADQYPLLPEAERDLRLPPGRDRDVGHYYSIQHQFPVAYGIGEMGLPASAPPQRQAQAKQLKAYLLFFDQLLANEFAQLANAKDLFAFDSPPPRTYFTQLIDDPRLGLDDIWRNDRDTRAANLQEFAEGQVAGAAEAGRKSRFLDHLLARFAEEFADYSQHLAARAAPAELLAAKSAFLRDYRALGAARGRAFDVTLPAWGTDNLSGLEQRISRKLGLAESLRRDLADLADDDGGFHMLEPILLRPQPADLAQWAQTSDAVGWQSPLLLTLPQAGDQPPRREPFSMRLCFVFPDWTSRFDPDFVRRMLREETPAHLDIQLQWLSRDQMRAFETAYKDWLASSAADAVGAAPPAPGLAVSDQVRAARDRLIDLLRIGNPYPLRDLELSYPQKVAPHLPADIAILGAQLGVRYQLCDQDGNPVVVSGSPIEIARAVGQADDQVILKTPSIDEDTTFTILATRDADAYSTPLDLPLETYLTATISIKVGIDTSLPVAPEPGAEQSSQGVQITVSYGDMVTVAVSASQEGISYVLVKVGEDTALSRPVQGNKDRIALVSGALMEDTDLQVKAYRTQASSVKDRLTTTISVHVRPNPSVTVTVDPAAPPIVAFNAGATLALENAQASATYQLYRRQLAPAEYVTDATPDRLLVPETGVFVQAPERTTGGGDPAGFELVGSFAAAGPKLSIASGSLTEDSIFIVLATKIDNHERLQLDQAVVVLARPDPGPLVGVGQSPLAAGAEGIVTVSGTQQGVRYQLLRDSDGSAINLPGYDYRDRGIGTTRVAVDFVVEAPSDPVASQTLVLPSGPVADTTTYRVLATKSLSGVSAELTGKATIAVQQAQP